MPEPESTTVVIAGGGPAGMMAGLLLARAGIDVHVLEKHCDFLRDFRGDTVHPSTLDLLDALGLAKRFQRIPQRRVVQFGGGEMMLGSLAELDVRHRYIALVPQWDLLELLASEAARWPTFHLQMNADVVGLVRSSGKVLGVRYRAGRREYTLHAVLTIGADGRHSVVRKAARFRVHTFGVPLDVLWFKLPLLPHRDDALYARVVPHRWMVAFARPEYMQVAYGIRKGSFPRVKARGIAAFRRDIAEAAPEFAAGVHTLRSFRDVGFLSVRIDRARRWHRPGLLLIGDAAHAMSPIGGVGINYAIQDAVATANLLYAALRKSQRTGVELPESALARVQLRRKPPAVVIQGIQRLIQARLIEPALRGDVSALPRFFATLRRFGPIRRRLLRTIAVGVLPERLRAPATQPRRRPAPRPARRRK